MKKLATDNERVVDVEVKVRSVDKMANALN